MEGVWALMSDKLYSHSNHTCCLLINYMSQQKLSLLWVKNDHQISVA